MRVNLVHKKFFALIWGLSLLVTTSNVAATQFYVYPSQVNVSILYSKSIAFNFLLNKTDSRVFEGNAVFECLNCKKDIRVMGIYLGSLETTLRHKLEPKNFIISNSSQTFVLTLGPFVPKMIYYEFKAGKSGLRIPIPTIPLRKEIYKCRVIFSVQTESFKLTIPTRVNLEIHGFSEEFFYIVLFLLLLSASLFLSFKFRSEIKNLFSLP